MSDTLIGDLVRPIMKKGGDVWEIWIRGHRYFGEGESDRDALLKAFGTSWEEMVKSAKENGSFIE